MEPSGTSSKSYWALVNTFLNKGKIPIIPLLLESGLFITDYKEKALTFNNYDIRQSIATDTGCSIPQNTRVTSIPISDFVICEVKIPDIIKSLNPNKAHGWDKILVRMIKLGDSSLVLPLKINFQKLLEARFIP